MARKIKDIGAMISIIMVLLLGLTACGVGRTEPSHDNTANSTIILNAVSHNDLSGTIKTQEPETVLYIYHSHSFETYSDGTSVIEVGKALSDYISKMYDITVIHDTAEYGKQSKVRAYEESLIGIKLSLKNNPEITHFIDIQRDIAPDKLTINIDGKDIAPVSMVVGKGSNYSGDEKPDYELNYAFAEKIHEQLAAKSDEGLVFPLVEKDGRYNQHLPGTCVLINVGFDKNNFAETTEVVPYLAEAIANAIANQ